LNVPDNKFIIRLNTWRAGFKKQDLWTLGGVLMACQLAIDKFMKQMRKKEKTLQMIE
jgi:hypothetical protein